MTGQGVEQPRPQSPEGADDAVASPSGGLAVTPSGGPSLSGNPPVDVRVLGETLVLIDGRPVTLGGPKPRSLVAVLALSPSVTVPAARIIELLWGEDAPAKALNNVQVYVSRLRKQLRDPRDGEPFLLASSAGYQLRLPAEAVDAARFQRWVEAARRLIASGQPEAAEDLLARAEELWRGEDLPDLSVLPNGAALTRHLLDLRAAARVERVEAGLAQGRYAEALPTLRAMLAEDALDERVAGLLMTALYGAGRQSQALAVYQETVTALDDELGVDPGPALKALHQRVLRQELDVVAAAHAPPPPTGSPPPDQAQGEAPATARSTGTPHALPAFTRDHEPLVGRLPELERLLGLVADPAQHLITMTGPGGTGKTRLAREVAQRVAVAPAGGSDGPPRPVVFVPLAASSHPDEILPGVVAAITGSLPDHLATGLPAAAADAGPGRRPPLDVVVEALAGRAALVVLDNLEQLVDAHGVPAPVGALLDAVPDVTVLATSRSVLRLRGETLVPLEPLPLPPAGCLDAARVQASDAVQLFRQRARAVLPGFDVDPANAAAVAEVVRLLDGLPLALELAAARVRVLPPQELLRRMDHRLRLLTGGPGDAPERQRSMRAALDWSANLLDPAESLLFARLGAFHGGWTLAAAEEVCADAPDHDGPVALDEFEVVDALGRLVDKSLVVATGSGRFSMLETVRTYAAERLEGAPDAGRAVRDRHLARMLRLAEEFGPRSRHHLDPEAAAVLEVEAANLQAALEHAHATSDGLGLGRMVVALLDYWFFAGRSRQAIGWVQAARDADVPARLRAEILVGAGSVALVNGDLAQAVPLHTAALAAAREADEPFLVMRAHGSLAIAARYGGDHERALAEMDAAMDAAARAGWEHGTPHLLNERGELLDELDRGADADEHYERARQWAVDHDTDGVLAYVLANQALRAQDAGDPVLAAQAARAGSDAARAEGSVTVLGDVLPVLALVHLRAGDAATARSLLRESATAAHASGMLMTLTMTAGLLGAAALAGGDAEGAARVLAAAKAWRDARGLVPVGRVARDVVASAEALVADRLPAGTLAACRAWGAAVPFGQVSALLDAVTPPAAAPAVVDVRPRESRG
ncbi:MAG: BTAD domain-containing putative transcriptional regulator [Kineosporiaceae bacterium]